MIKVGVITNPTSQRNRRGLGELTAAIARHGDVVHLPTDSHPTPGDLLRDLAAREVGVVVVAGGDGTLQRILSALLEEHPFPHQPLIAVLPRGMANMTAGDVGLRGRDVATLERLVDHARRGDLEPHVTTRPILKVDGMPEGPPQRAVFFGAAGIYDAIDFCCREVYPRGLEGNLGMSLTVVGLLIGSLFGGRAAHVLRPHDVALGFDGGPLQPRRLTLILATTLERMILGARPFWNLQGQPIRCTSVGHPPIQAVRSTPKVMYGWRRSSLPPDTYQSRGAEQVAIQLDGPFTLDGELFDAPSDRPLQLSAAERVRFVRL